MRKRDSIDVHNPALVTLNGTISCLTLTRAYPTCLTCGKSTADSALKVGITGKLPDGLHEKTGNRMAICRREIKRALSGLMKYAYMLSRDSEAAGELVQETVLKALSTSKQPENVEGFRPWLFKILRNAHIDNVRRIRRHIDQHETVDDIDDLPAIVGQFEDTMINQLSVRRAVMRLPEAHRDILLLVDVSGFSYAEAAETLGIPKGTVMSRLSRARRAMLVEIGGGKVHSLETAREKKKASADK